jgi:hypothetical protein
MCERCSAAGKSYYIAPEDATLIAIDVSGKKLLDWLEYSLSVPLYFQTAQIVLGLDRSRDRPCRVNMLQVGPNVRRSIPRDPDCLVGGAGTGQLVAQRRRPRSDVPSG